MMSLIRISVYVLRCPLVRRMPLRRFFLKTRIFGPRDSPSTTPTTLTFGDVRRSRQNFAAFFLEHQDLVDRDLVARVGLESIDGDDVARRHLDLPTTALNDCEHG